MRTRFLAVLCGVALALLVGVTPDSWNPGTAGSEIIVAGPNEPGLV